MRHVKRSVESAGWLELAAGSLLAAGSALAMAVVSPSTAEAQGYRPYPVSRAEPAVRRVRSEPARPVIEVRKAKPESEPRKKAAEPVPQPAGPLLIMVNLRRQNLAVYAGANEVARSPISSGQTGFETPMGVFSIIQKNKEHFSNLYNDAPMPNMQRITWSGVALHAGNLPGYPASHGCVRLPLEFSKRLFAMTQMGTRVIVSNSDATPAPFAHNALFAPLPAGVPVAQALTGNGVSVSVTEVRVASIEETDTGAGAPAKRTRASVAAERAAEKARLAADVEARRQQHATIVETLKTANHALEQSRQSMRVLTTEAERAKRKAHAAAKVYEDVLEDLADLGRNAGERQSATGIVTLSAREEEMEVKLLSSQSSAEQLLAEAHDIAEELQSATELQSNLEAARRSAFSEAAIAADQLKVALNAQAQFAKEDAKRNLPVSVFVSRRTSKLYVRQGFEPVFEAPVTISEPHAPLGTHVFSALSTNGNSLLWNVVTVADAPLGTAAMQRTVAERNAARKAGEQAAPAQRQNLAVTPAMALERIDIPSYVRERIEELVKPGSSLIISDLPASHETGRGTDFVLLTR